MNSGGGHNRERGVAASKTEPESCPARESKTRDPAGCVPRIALSLRDDVRGVGATCAAAAK